MALQYKYTYTNVWKKVLKVVGVDKLKVYMIKEKYMVKNTECLKVVSATFVLVYF